MEPARDNFLRTLTFPENIRFRTSQEGMNILDNRNNRYTLRMHVTILKIVVKMQSFEHEWALSHLAESSPLYKAKVEELKATERELDQSYLARDRERATNSGNTDRWVGGFAIATGIALAPISGGASLAALLGGGSLLGASTLHYIMQKDEIEKTVALMKRNNISYAAAKLTVLQQKG